MAKSIHVKELTTWKRLAIPKSGFNENVFDGLVDVQELTDYEFVRLDKTRNKAKKRKATTEHLTSDSKKKKKDDQGSEEDKVEKKKKRKKKKKTNQLEDTSEVADGDGEGFVDRNESDDTSVVISHSNLEPELNFPVKSILKVNKDEIEVSGVENVGPKKKKGRSRSKKNKASADKVTPDVDNNAISQVKVATQPKPQSMECEENEVRDKSTTKKNKKKGKAKEKNNKALKKAVVNDHERSAVTGENVASSSKTDMSKWSNLFIPEALLKSLQEQGFQNPTTIQTLTLPSAIRDHKDILAAAETGSGKTLAFGIPVVSKILEHRQMVEEKKQMMDCENLVDDIESKDHDDDDGDDDDDDYNEVESGNDEKESSTQFDFDDDESESGTPHSPPHALILEPTRELAVQVHRHLSKLATHTNIRFAIVVGGMSVDKQRRLLKYRPEIIIATPGRLWQLIQEGDQHLRKIDLIHSLVVDEADRMVEKGHYEELTKLLHMINKSPRRDMKRQSFVMSATLTMEVAIPKRLLNKMKEKDLEKDKLKSLTSKICLGTKPKVVDLTPKDKVAQSLTEMRVNCSAKEKDFYLYYFLCQHPGRTLVFANSKDCLRRLVSVFNLLECSPYPLHADMQQRQRLKNLDRFAANSQGLLLASDVAARGLDIPNVDYVIHYQVPQTKENYVHRSGRTARASNVGLSVMLVAPEEARNYRRIVHGVKNGEELPIMPLDLDLMPAVKGRVELARSIDVAEHRSKKVKLHNDFFSKAAEEMDMILDDNVLVPGTDDVVTQSEEKGQLKQMKYQLSAMLKGSLAPLRMTKYPTKSGQLLSMKSVDLLSSV